MVVSNSQPSVVLYGSLNQVESDLSASEAGFYSETKPLKFDFSRLKAVVAIIIVTFAAACLSYKTYPSEQSQKRSEFDVTLTKTQLSIEASNEYGVFEGPYPWLNNVHGSQIVEPYKLTKLLVSGLYADNIDVYYQWTFESNHSLDTGIILGADVYNITLTQVGNHHVTVQAFDDARNLLASFSTLLMCKYVKREIRTLTIADRENFLDAAAVIWQHSQDEGVAKFGAKFTSIGNFVAIHSEASNDNMCDQFHDGTGFLTHHLALTNAFEAAIRSVNPSVTLPYWDFTVEGQIISDQDEAPSYLTSVSPIFTDEWFGAVDENNHIINSRWAHTPMPMQEDTTSGVRNSYGFIRSYWNNNPDKEITRHLFDVCGIEAKLKKIPNCGKHFEILDTQSLGDFLLNAPGDGHGPMHVAIGGMWGGCSDAYAALAIKWSKLLNQDMTQEEIDSFALDRPWSWGTESPRRKMVEAVVIGEYFHIYRSLWRSHMCAVDGTPSLLVCPKDCSLSTPFKDCHCQVERLVTNQTTWQNLLPCVLGSANSRLDFLASMPEEFLSDLVTMVATAAVLEGDMIESSSPSDIIFWLIHPCIERLLSAKRLTTVKTMNGFEIRKWPELHDKTIDSWVQFSVYDFEKGENAHYPEKYSCYGHAANSTILSYSRLTDIVESTADVDGDGLVSNWEYYQTLDPNDPVANDYVFDHFKWDHCDNTLVAKAVVPLP